MLKQQIELLILFTVFLSLETAFGQVVVRHSGSQNPITEGWIKQSSGSDVFELPIENDLGLGLDAWSIDDHSTSNDFLYYIAYLSTNDQQLINTYGWRLNIRVRVVDFPTDLSDASINNNSLAVKLRPGTGGCNQDLIIGSGLSDGQPSIIVNGIHHWVDDYAEIIIEYVPEFGDWGSASADMSINGSIRSTSTAPPLNGSGQPHIAFGCFGGTTIGHGAWNRVELEALPPVTSPTITSLTSVSADRVQLEITDIRKGVYYQVLTTDDLSSTNWNIKAGYRPNITGSDSWTVYNITNASGYFKLITK